MVSIKTIAEECSVSVATVSKALNNHSDVSESTKKMVCETAKRLGYFPNAQARALKTNRTYNIGVLLDDKAHNGLTHSFFSSVLDSFRVTAEKQGFDITFICGKIGDSIMSYYEHCRYRQVDGILAACVDFYDSEVSKLFSSEIPIVSIDFQTPDQYSVSSDNSLGMKEIVEYVYNCGHTKIAYIYGESSQVTTNRLNSYIDTMKNLGIQVQPDYLRQGKYHDADGSEKLTAAMFELYDPPTCIILPDDVCTIGAMNAAKKAGLSIPDDVSVVGFDGIRMTQLITPNVTTYYQDTVEIGRCAAESLVKLIRKEEIPEAEREIIIGGRLIKGNTVKYIKQFP
ncbi:MAG: LacI family DNA-binding transcriptional regulator [Porcipelethomonas sp.]